MDSYNYIPYRIPDYKTGFLKDPHVVIIGAGASKAACPNGDRNGQLIPLLKDISKKIESIADILRPYNFSNELLDDFESLYSYINTKKKYKSLIVLLENQIRNYFEGLQLPQDVNLYDYLVLSLAEKDAIISFNWDPLLMQAYVRNRCVGNLPQLIFPHGNVSVQCCYKYRNFHAYDSNLCDFCADCKERMQPMRLLYPIEKKDYSKDNLISSEWKRAEYFLTRAAGITIFGYGAPDTDIDALNLLKESYKESRTSTIAPFTIINLPDVEEEQKEKWSDIYDSGMFIYCNTFFGSDLWKHPRVSLETLFDAILQQHPRTEERPFANFNSLNDLQSFVRSINSYKMWPWSNKDETQY